MMEKAQDEETPSEEANITIQGEAGEKENRLESCIFDPPLYRQRYNAVAEILRNERIQSVIDFGTAECNILQYYKGIETMEHIVGVDIDKPKLQHHIFKTRPLTTDYLQPRSRPLQIQLYYGSVIEFDSRLADIEAVTMVEVIEHLEDDVLEQLPRVLFGQYSPKIIIMTTPNSEYNVLFPNFTGFRHWDHKFEWTRQEFKDWCEPVAKEYGYTVIYEGIGSGRIGTEHLGHCSQMAVFTKIQLTQQHSVYYKSNSTEGQETYELIVECHHPCVQDSEYTEEERTMHEVLYYINILTNDFKNKQIYGDDDYNDEDYSQNEEDYNQDTSQFELPLADLLEFQKLKSLFGDLNQLRELLMRNGYKISEDNTKVIISIEDEETSGFDNDNYSEPSSEDFCYNTGVNTMMASDNIDTCEESWDNDIEVVPIPKLEILSDSEDTFNDTHIQSKPLRFKRLWTNEPKLGKIGSYLSTGEKESDWKTGCIPGQFMDANVELSGSWTDDSNLDTLQNTCTNCGNWDEFCCGKWDKLYKPDAVQGTGVDYCTEQYQKENVSDNSNCKTLLTQTGRQCSDKINTRCDVPSGSLPLTQDNTNDDSTSITGASIDTVHCYDQPYLSLDNEIICKGCGCKIRKLLNGENLCGLTKNCKSSFIEKFSQKFSNVSLNEGRNDFLGIDEGQFSDVESFD